jgi:hypothetical protein
MATILDKLSPAARESIVNAARVRGQLRPLCEELGLNFDSVRGALSRAGLYDSDENAPSQALDILKTLRSLGPVPQAVKIVEEPKPLYLDRWLYAADFHVPFHSELALERLVSVGLALEVEDLVVGGDLLDFDSLSTHPADLPQVDLNQAIEIGGQVIRYLRSAFKRLYIVPGNHDRRAAKALGPKGANLSFTHVLRMCAGDLDGITASDNDYFYIGDSTPERPGFSAGHPRFFASFPAKGLDAVALQRQRHVLGAHAHTLGAAKIGKFWCVSPGMMCDTSITPYIVRSNGLSKHADQAHGFVLVETTDSDGDVVTLFADGLTRWSDYD